MLDTVILAVIVLALLGERVWERVWAEVPAQVTVERPSLVPPSSPEPVIEYVERRPVPAQAEWDGYEGQAGLS